MGRHANSAGKGKSHAHSRKRGPSRQEQILRAQERKARRKVQSDEASKRAKRRELQRLSNSDEAVLLAAVHLTLGAG